MSEVQLSDVARFCNRYPDIQMTHGVANADNLTAGEPVTVEVTLERAALEGDLAPVDAARCNLQLNLAATNVPCGLVLLNASQVPGYFRFVPLNSRCDGSPGLAERVPSAAKSRSELLGCSWPTRGCYLCMLRARSLALLP